MKRWYKDTGHANCLFHDYGIVNYFLSLVRHFPVPFNFSLSVVRINHVIYIYFGHL